MSDYEIVHTMTDYYDGPRGGIADFGGVPHVYQSDYADQDGDQETFLLMAVNDATFELALEDWAIWLRWETALHSGKATLDTHPALPEDRPRHEKITKLLEGKLTVDPSHAKRATAEFRRRENAKWSGKGWAPLEVRWTIIEKDE
jgi:hypothetical protein